MIERDYIMRMIQMLTNALAQILFFKKGAQYTEALHDIQTVGEKIIGMKWELLKKLSDAQIVELLSTDQDLGTPKLYVAGVLLKEEGEIDRLAGRTDDAVQKFATGLSLLTESYVTAQGAMTPDHSAAIESLVASLDRYEIPFHIKKRLFPFYELIGYYGKAEDVLFDLVEADEAFVTVGIEFYSRISKKSDEELLKGNLPRAEIEDGVLALQEKIAS